MISWRVWLVSILGYASLYAFKRATHDPERDVKDQVSGLQSLNKQYQSVIIAGEACEVKVEHGDSEHMQWV